MSNTKILIVDDEYIQRKIISHVLNKTIRIPPPLDIYEAEDGNIAVSKIIEEDIQLIIMDITMPNCDGIEATKLIRMFNRTVKIYACTAADITSHLKDQCLKIGMNGFFHKPFTINSANTLNKVLFNLK